MPETYTEFVPVSASLADCCGSAYVHAVAEARAFLSGENPDSFRAWATEQIAFYPESVHKRLCALLPQVGKTVAPMPEATATGAGTDAFTAATKTGMAPLSALGWYRYGEDGKLYLTSKSEHYHTALGHAFPGYALLERARRLGIPNATHNNTRGPITRLLEEQLISAANGIDSSDRNALDSVLAATDPQVLNRVLNLETGSLAVEAALKMILARFYRMQEGMAPPNYQGSTPVILVMGDDDGGLGGNYHGTTVLTQCMRGMWPELTTSLEEAAAFHVQAIRPNHIGDLEHAFERYETGRFKIAGFFHEIVMMNYGGVLLTREFLQRAYALCQEHDVPTVADEIQSCAWAPELFLYREYNLKPTFVALGKGFPGGEYPASRILFSAALDNAMPQFGALVTNGQEELASLAYLVTMRWAQANAGVTRRIGEAYAAQLHELAGRFDGLIDKIEGWGHMSTIFVRDLATAKKVAALLVEQGLDISAQAYKADCPPALLTKLPLIAGQEVVDFILTQLEQAFTAVSEG